MTENQFKIIDKNNIADHEIIQDTSLDELNSVKECESSEEENYVNDYDKVIICIDNAPHCITTIENIEKKMFNVAVSIKNSISTYDNDVNIYKKNDEIIVSVRYKMVLFSYETIYSSISFMFIKNYENLY